MSYLKEISFEIGISFNIKCNDGGILFDCSTSFSFGGMSSTVLAFEAHDNEIAEIGYADFAHSSLSHHLASVAGYFKDGCFLMHKIIFLERFGEIHLIAVNLFLDMFHIHDGVLLTVAHLDQLLHWSLEMSDFYIFVLFGSIGILDVWVTAGVSYFYCEREFLSIQILFDCC